MVYLKQLPLRHVKNLLRPRKRTFSSLVGAHIHIERLSHINRVLVERIMRVLVCNGFASEQGPGQYEPTELSRQMTERRTIGTMDSLYVYCLFFQVPQLLAISDLTINLGSSTFCLSFRKHPSSFKRLNTRILETPRMVHCSMPTTQLVPAGTG